MRAADRLRRWRVAGGILLLSAAVFAQDSRAGRDCAADAPSRDDGPASRSRFALNCDALAAPVDVSFVATEPAAAHLTWEGTELVATQVPSASGAKYTAPYRGGEFVIWTKAADARIERPGEPPLRCTLTASP